MTRIPTLTALLVLALAAGTAAAQEIDPTRGADPGVDYVALTRIGPWDDRNYELTREDLALLAPNEEEQVGPLPAFFRVELRRARPELRRRGPAQYPRSALQIFRLLYDGYLVDGQVFRGATRQDGRWIVLEVEGIPRDQVKQRFLAGEVRVTSPEGAAESAVKVHPTNSDLVIAGSNGPGAGQRMHFSSDGGETWTETSLPLGGTCCDPTVDWSSDGTYAHTATLGDCVASGCAVWYYRSSDHGQTWNDLASVTPGDPRRELTATGSDKEFIHVDKHPTSPHKDNVYLTWHDNNVLKFAVSTNHGHTWTTTSFAGDPQGIGSDITTDKNGNIYYFWPDFDAPEIVMKKSTNGGASFEAVRTVASTQASFIFPIPSMETREVFLYASADVDLSDGPFGNSVYVAWTDSTAPPGATPSNNHARIRVAYSRDGGATWTVTTPHPTADQNQVDRWHQWLAVDPTGRVHVVYYDTQRDPSRTSVDLFYTFSTDGAQTFETPVRVTSAQSPNIADSFEFGDYNGLDATLGNLIAVFTDNRAEGGGGDSVDVYAVGRASGLIIFVDGFEQGNTSAWSGEVP